MNPAYSEMSKAIRFLAIDAVQKAKSGHPGMPLGMADVATVLFSDFLKFNPKDPGWFDRDRFVLSNGHGSMLLYAILYLTGYLEISDIKNFRQLNSLTPGHPECGHTPGVEVTTGPLGQGLACAIGMAIAEANLSARFGTDLVNHYTYVTVGDGCLMEGISHEAASLAGHLRLRKIIAFFDDNQISIDGKVSLSSSDDITMRFKAYGWEVQEIDGHNFAEIKSAIVEAQKTDRPSLIRCKTIIGKFVATREDKSSAHSGPFTEQEVAAMRQTLHWNFEPFVIPENIKEYWRSVASRSLNNYQDWIKKYQQSTEEFKRIVNSDLPKSAFEALAVLKKEIHDFAPTEATRKSSGRVVSALSMLMPELLGGSADLTESNHTKAATMDAISAEDYANSYIYYGIREHAMAACMNGIALHRGFIPYGGTFLVFSDYCRPAIRLSALMKQQVIYIMTHDSIGVGEDGPTHQPVEHLSSLRSIPNLYVFRPADAAETLECWEMALQIRNAPSLFALSRQNVSYNRRALTENLSSKGAYILTEASFALQVTIFSSGSELAIALKAHKLLEAAGIGVRVISVPCWRLFDEQDSSYIARILENNSIKVAVEAGSSFGWSKYIGPKGLFFGIDSFGSSAPADVLYNHFHITADHIVQQVLQKI